jgi:hypothetical protein
VGTVFTATNATTGTGQAETVYSWSTTQTQTVTADSIFLINRTITCLNSLQGTNPANVIVTKNGQRLRPPEGIEWIGNGTTVSFGLPQRGGYSQQIIDAATDITVWVNGILQTQSIGPTIGNYGVTNWDGSNDPGRQVVFVQPPQPGARILISVNTVSDYQVSATVNQIAISTIVNLGDILEVITWNDTSQQNILTQVFQGPVNTSVIVYEPYDTTVFDLATAPNNNTPGTFDYSIGELLPVNNFDLGRTGVNGNRLWVTLDGLQLFDGTDFVIQGQYLILSSGTIGPGQVLVVTQFTTSTVPEAVAFRIFQDMRGAQATYRITDATTTTLAQSVTSTADQIFVANVSALTEPNLALGIFGAVTIDGERIMYRVRDTATNSISSLLRGTAGTGAADHQTGTAVYDIGRGNLLNQDYQNYIVSDTSMGDDSTTIFYAPSIRIFDFEDSAVEVSGLEVYVGGIRQYAQSNDGSTLITTPSQYRWNCIDGGGPDYIDAAGDTVHNPLTIEFVVDTAVFPQLLAPAAGSDVTILVRQGVTWYAPGADTASNGVALQETDTTAARFLCNR